MASTSDAAPPETDPPGWCAAGPMLNFVPTADDLLGFEWKGVQLSIPTKEFGEAWANNTLGKNWKVERPFLKALVVRKVRKSKNKEQTWELIVAYDASKYKKNAQYLYDRAKDPEAVKEQLKSKAAALRAADEAKTADAAAAAVAPVPATPAAQPADEPSIQNSDEAAIPLVAPTKKAFKPRAKRQRGRPISAAKRKQAANAAAALENDVGTESEEEDSDRSAPDSSDTESESDGEPQEGPKEIIWVDEGENPDKPRAARTDIKDPGQSLPPRPRLLRIDVLSV